MSAGRTRLDAAELERRLESLVFLVLNSRRSVAPAAAEVAGVIDRFVCGLGGHALKLAPGEVNYTDTIGRPDGQEGYRGTYGVEDTRQALIEARNTGGGVHPFCITIDDEALEYLPHMYGPASFTVVSQVERLPFRVSDIYRRITR